MVTTLCCIAVFLGAAPRQDGRYVSEPVAKAIRDGTFGELDISSGATFGPKEVELGFGLEEELRLWAWSSGRLLVGEKEVHWKVGVDGVVETDLMDRVERLVFLKGVTKDTLRARLAANRRAHFLEKWSGTWRGGADSLVVTPKTLAWNGKAAKVTSCAVSCQEQNVCVSVGERLLAPVEGRLVEVRIEGLCVGWKTGVERVDGGVALERASEERSKMERVAPSR